MSQAGEHQDRIYSDLAELAERLHGIVSDLAIHPREIAAVVTACALKETTVRGKRRNRFAGFIAREVDCLRTKQAEERPSEAP